MVIKDIQHVIFSVFSILFIIIALTSCSEFRSISFVDQGSVSHDGKNMSLEFPVPRFLGESASVIDSLQARATIDGGNSHNLDVNPNTKKQAVPLPGCPPGPMIW